MSFPGSYCFGVIDSTPELDQILVAHMTLLTGPYAARFSTRFLTANGFYSNARKVATRLLADIAVSTADFNSVSVALLFAFCWQ